MAKKKKPSKAPLTIKVKKRKAGAGAPEGNNNAEKLPTPALRQAAFAAYCQHIASGFSDKAFHTPCTARTIDNMLKKYPDEFDLDALTAARAQGCHLWEQMGMAGAAGKLKNFNPSAWIFNMKNRLGWKDRQEIGLDKPTRAVFKMRMGKDLSSNPDETED